MIKKLKITPFGQKKLREKYQEYRKELSGVVRQGNVVREAQLKSNLGQLEEIIENAIIYEFSESNPAQIILGAKVILENLINGDKREYTILCRSASDPLNGVISDESPLAQKMLGLKLGNTFKFKDIAGIEEGFKIISIE